MENFTTFSENIAAGPESAVLNESFNTYIPNCLGKRLHEVFLKGGILTDMSIVTSTTKIAAHRAVLACRSSFICSAIQWQDNHDSMQLSMPEISDAEARTILHCLYTDQVDWGTNETDPMRLLELSDRF